MIEDNHPKRRTPTFRGTEEPPPFLQNERLEVAWVEEKDWWYRKEFHVVKEFLNPDRVEQVL